jgi:hypothetical protein
LVPHWPFSTPIRVSASNVEDAVAAFGLDRRVDVALRKAEGAAEHRFHALARRQRGHGGSLARAAHQEGFGPAFAQAVAERLHVGDEAAVARRFGADQEIGQCRAGELLLLPALQRPEAGHQPRLGREGSEQPLREGVDRHDPEAPARGVEHAGEQAAGLRELVRPGLLAEREQLLPELGILEPHPISEAGMDAIRHLGRARLGEGEAQDRGRIGAAKQQPQHPRGQHVRLARPRRGGQSGMGVRSGRLGLLAFEANQAA